MAGAAPHSYATTGAISHVADAGQAPDGDGAPATTALARSTLSRTLQARRQLDTASAPPPTISANAVRGLAVASID